jgi:hypothetical protein
MFHIRASHVGGDAQIDSLTIVDAGRQMSLNFGAQPSADPALMS